MARLSNETSLAAFAAAYQANGPRLVVLGQGSFAGRVSSLIKVRPTLWERLGELAAGQQYLLVDVALQVLIDHLENRNPADETRRHPVRSLAGLLARRGGAVSGDRRRSGQGVRLYDQG